MGWLLISASKDRVYRSQMSVGGAFATVKKKKKKKKKCFVCNISFRFPTTTTISLSVIKKEEKAKPENFPRPYNDSLTN